MKMNIESTALVLAFGKAERNGEKRKEVKKKKKENQTQKPKIQQKKNVKKCQGET